MKSTYQQNLNKVIDDLLADCSENDEGTNTDKQVLKNAKILARWIIYNVENGWECLRSAKMEVLTHGTIEFNWYINRKKKLSLEVGATRISYFEPRETFFKKEGNYTTVSSNHIFFYLDLNKLEIEVSQAKGKHVNNPQLPISGYSFVENIILNTNHVL